MSEKDALENNRIIYMQGLINEDKAKEVITKLIELDTKNPSKDILLIIDSYGGMVHSFLAIHDVMKYVIRSDISTLALGKTMSCGQMLLMSGAKGKRFVTPNTRVLMHEISSGTYGSISDMENDLEEGKKLMDIMNGLILKYTKISKSKLKEIMSKDSYMSSQEAISLGIADKMINHPRDLYPKS